MDVDFESPFQVDLSHNNSLLVSCTPSLRWYLMFPLDFSMMVSFPRPLLSNSSTCNHERECVRVCVFMEFVCGTSTTCRCLQ